MRRGQTREKKTTIQTVLVEKQQIMKKELKRKRKMEKENLFNHMFTVDVKLNHRK